MVVLEVMIMLMMNIKTIQNYKQGLIDKNILYKGGVKKY